MIKALQLMLMNASRQNATESQDRRDVTAARQNLGMKGKMMNVWTLLQPNAGAGSLH